MYQYVKLTERLREVSVSLARELLDYADNQADQELRKLWRKVGMLTFQMALLKDGSYALPEEEVKAIWEQTTREVEG